MLSWVGKGKEAARIAAEHDGQPMYQTSRICQRGHLEMRYTNGGACVPCQNAARATRSAAKAAARQIAGPKPLTPRQIAKANGETRYNTGVQCKNGHMADRMVCDGKCVECLAGNMQAWLSKNGNRERNATNKAQWAKENAERVANQRHEAFKKDQPRRQAKSREWYLANKDKHREYSRTSRRRNPALGRANTSIRNKRVKMATPPHADLKKMKAIYLLRPVGYEVDHMVPLKATTANKVRIACGLHTPENLQYLNRSANSSKSNLWPYPESIDSCAIVPFSWEHFLVISEQAQRS